MWLDNLKKMKSASNMTTKEISTKSSIPEPTLEKLFAGVTKDPKLDTMKAVVHVLGYTLDEVVSGIKPAGASESEDVISQLAPDEQQLLTGYRSLNKQGQEYILQTLDMASRVYIKSDDLPNLEDRIG